MAIPDFSAYTVANAEVTSATKFDNFVTALQTALNNIGNPANTTWAPGQILAPSQISQGGATTNQGLAWSGSAYVPANLAVINVKTSTGTTVLNTTTETDLLTGTTGTGYLVIPAGKLSATGGLRLTIGGTYTNNSGASRTLRLKWRFGASAGLPSFTTFAAQYDSGVSDTVGASANPRSWECAIQLQALASVSSEGGSGLFVMSSANAPTTGVGPIVSPNNNALVGPIGLSAAAAVDFSADVGMVLSLIHSTASGSLSMVTTWGRIEVS